MTKTKISVAVLGSVLLIYVLIRLLVPAMLEKDMNQIKAIPNLKVSEQSQLLHDSLFVGDWHADSTLWDRNLAEQSNYGHVDIPRLQKGNVSLQMFTTVTKSPDGLNYEKNESDAADNITKAALVQGWPISTLTSLNARALFQANKLANIAQQNPDDLVMITSQKSLADFLNAKNANPTLVGGLLGTEGSHALDGDLNNIQVLFDAGFRMMSLQHFFDNKLGGSLHGTSNTGLSEFGKQAVQMMQSLNIIIDVSHSSQQTVMDVLQISSAPLVLSHTGFNGHCPSKRNIDDSLMKKIAEGGGIIAVGYWDEAVCGIHPDDIADAIIYGIQLVGEDAISLGSDYDGAVTVSFATDKLALITQALLQKGVSQQVIGKVMGANMLRFLTVNLPQN